MLILFFFAKYAKKLLFTQHTRSLSRRRCYNKANVAAAGSRLRSWQPVLVGFGSAGQPGSQLSHPLLCRSAFSLTSLQVSFLTHFFAGQLSHTLLCRSAFSPTYLQVLQEILSFTYIQVSIFLKFLYTVFLYIYWNNVIFKKIKTPVIVFI